MKQLLINLDVCSGCNDCAAICSYIRHPGNNGLISLLEFAHFAIFCRRCEDSPCVASCPAQALEFQPQNSLKRYMMRCTSCKTCSGACPFGVIYPETIPFITSRCDYCLGRIEGDQSPVCLEMCAHGGIRFGEFEEKIEENIFRISEHLFVKTSFKWQGRGEGIPVKKRIPA
ncbi:MAG: 4Fe-4S binding protein [Candidatus Omnitrophota bacterium]|nr:4Fe-4S binding protein [Candidatus Omnitrophota bacterium]